MPSAPHHPQEAARLAALQALEVLDSAPQAEFDALVKAASLVCQTPISLISLVDDHRQWFKANVGLPGVSETPREMAFCAHAILDDEVMVVPDATQDTRFIDNPLVTGQPEIRFYAGAPLRLRNGHQVGTLCVIDRQAREINASQRDILRCLAVAAANALESRLAQQQLAAAQTQLLELRAEQAQQEAQAATQRAKEAFFSRVSHEMRTPLNAVLGFAQLLHTKLQTQDDTSVDYTTYIMDAGQHLTSMVEDLLDIRAAAQGELSLRNEAVDVAKAIASAVGLLSATAAAQNTTITMQAQDCPDAWADATRLKQVLLNLLSNSIKYGRSHGQVTVKAQAAQEGICITVQDDGIGMNEAQVAALFQPFDRLGQERSRIAGVGLGLLISRRIVESMQGQLRMSSEPGVGTRALVFLPRAPAVP
jgi:two-component system, sensor histidine kinase